MSFTIYSITNTKTEKTYIGQTGREVYARWADHIKGLKMGTYYNTELCEDWLKYGRDAFEFKILERCNTKPEAITLERKWISLTPLTYNIIDSNKKRGKQSREKLYTPPNIDKTGIKQTSTKEQRKFYGYLNEQCVREIRALYPSMTMNAIGIRYGVSHPMVSKIISGKSYGWVE